MFTWFYMCLSYVSHLSHPIAPDHEKTVAVAAPERMKQWLHITQWQISYCVWNLKDLHQWVAINFCGAWCSCSFRKIWVRISFGCKVDSCAKIGKLKGNSRMHGHMSSIRTWLLSLTENQTLCSSLGWCEVVWTVEWQTLSHGPPPKKWALNSCQRTSTAVFIPPSWPSLKTIKTMAFLEPWWNQMITCTNRLGKLWRTEEKL